MNIKLIIEQERIAYIKGEIEKAALLRAIIDAYRR